MLKLSIDQYTLKTNGIICFDNYYLNDMTSHVYAIHKYLNIILVLTCLIRM